VKRSQKRIADALVVGRMVCSECNGTARYAVVSAVLSGIVCANRATALRAAHATAQTLWRTLAIRSLC